MLPVDMAGLARQQMTGSLELTATTINAFSKGLNVAIARRETNFVDLISHKERCDNSPDLVRRKMSDYEVQFEANP